MTLFLKAISTVPPSVEPELAVSLSSFTGKSSLRDVRTELCQNVSTIKCITQLRLNKISKSERIQFFVIFNLCISLPVCNDSHLSDAVKCSPSDYETAWMLSMLSLLNKINSKTRSDVSSRKNSAWKPDGIGLISWGELSDLRASGNLEVSQHGLRCLTSWIGVLCKTVLPQIVSVRILVCFSLIQWVPVNKSKL